MNAKVGRNDPCPCGSGKKYKNCCYGKEEKKTYTPEGKRKFKAKLLSGASGAGDVFRASTPKPLSIATSSPEELKFKITQSDFRQKATPNPHVRAPESSDPTEQRQPPTAPPDKPFEPAQEDFRTEK